MTTKARRAKLKQVAKGRLPEIRLVLEDVYDPHNAAAMLRTCDALGVGSVWYLFDKEEAYNPRKVGKLSSATSNKWVDTRVFTDREEMVKLLAERSFVSIATTIHESDAEELWEGDFTSGKLALWVGNENRGLSPEALVTCNRKVTVPMMGFVESLNVSVAAAIILAEIVRQRRVTGE